MKLIKPKAELLLQQPGLEGVYKQIELAGRTCYKSTDKITEDSAKPFVDRMINSNHLAMLEHGTIYLKDESWIGSTLKKYAHNKYSRYKDVHLESEEVEEGYREHKRGYYVTTNLRVLVENGWLDDLKYICEPTEYHEKRYTFRLTTSIGVTRELNRHRVNSIAEQSTRYCNYSKDKFGGEVTFCIPSWLDLKEGSYNWLDYYNDEFRVVDLSSPMEDQFVAYLFTASNQYIELIDQGWQPQQAREVLPLCTATEIIHTAFASDWKHFFDLRYFGTTGKPHPNMIELSTLMKKEAEKYGILDDILNNR